MKRLKVKSIRTCTSIPARPRPRSRPKTLKHLFWTSSSILSQTFTSGRSRIWTYRRCIRIQDFLVASQRAGRPEVSRSLQDIDYFFPTPTSSVKCLHRLQKNSLRKFWAQNQAESTTRGGHFNPRIWIPQLQAQRIHQQCRRVVLRNTFYPLRPLSKAVP